MKGLIISSIMIIAIFALIGFIWGRLRPLEPQVVYLDLIPSYRNHVLQTIEKEKLLSNENIPNKKEDFTPIITPRIPDNIPSSVEDTKEKPLESLSSKPSIDTPKVPLSEKEDVEEPKPNFFQKTVAWLEGLFLDKKKEQGKTEIKKELSLSRDIETLPQKEVPSSEKKDKETFLEKEEGTSSKERYEKRSLEEKESKTSPSKTSKENKKSPKENLLKDVDIAHFLLKTEVLPGKK